MGADSLTNQPDKHRNVGCSHSVGNRISMNRHLLPQGIAEKSAHSAFDFAQDDDLDWAELIEAKSSGAVSRGIAGSQTFQVLETWKVFAGREGD